MRTSSAAHADYDGSSSPDPLASLVNSKVNSVHKLDRSTTLPGTQRHNGARKSHDNISILPPSSPSRTVTEQTLSPWKIRVTVETEPEGHTSGKVETITRTMQIPLRGGSSPAQGDVEIHKRTQTRNRAASASKRSQRSATPTTERRRRQSVTDLDVIVLGDDADEDEWTNTSPRKSPRKSRAKNSTPKKKTDDTSSAYRAAFSVRQDTDAEDDGITTVREDTPELRQIDLNRVSVRSRANSTKQKVQFSNENGSDEVFSALKPIQSISIAGRRTVSANSAMTYPTPSPTASERGQSVEVEEAYNLGRDHAEGFDTIMESEGFTMIDLDSLPSVKQTLSSPLDGQAAAANRESKSPAESENSIRKNSSTLTSRKDHLLIGPTKGALPHLVLPEGVSEISSTVPSSPPAFHDRPQLLRQKTPLTHLQVPVQPRNRQVTPQPYSSPKLPSPPKQPTPKDRSTPDSAKALKAALALQSAMDPGPTPVQIHSIPKDSVHVRSSSDELFEGFDSGTQRELRAGLRFGEELAKRQASIAYAPKFSQNLNSIASTHIWRGESVISRTPVQAQTSSERTSQSKSLQPVDRQSSEALNPTVEPPSQRLRLDTPADQEQEWARELRLVSKQIENAAPSQVIVIDSDEEGQSYNSQEAQVESSHDVTMSDDEGDIWLEEAKDASSSPKQSSESSAIGDATEVTEQSLRSGKADVPKNNEQPDHNNSTVMTTGEEQSGMFWKQHTQDEVHFGAAAINNVRKEASKSGGIGFLPRRNSGVFDIEKMLDTPKRIRESIEKQQIEQGLFSNTAHILAAPALDQTHVTVNEQEWDEETSQELESSSSTPEDLQIVQVKFNDTTLSEQQTTPPVSSRQRTAFSPSAQPPTPRSAMKGSRQSLGINHDQMSTEQDNADRRVIFAERSKGVNVDWVESSSSIRSSTEDECSSPLVEHQKHQEERQIVLASSPYSREIVEPVQVVESNDEGHEIKDKQAQKNWLGWLWKSEQSEKQVNGQPTPLAVQTDGTIETSHPTIPAAKYEEQWAPTSRNAVRGLASTQPVSRIPSYLSTPSYPSDPTRSITQPLATSGKFTNHHFRTLHILHRKSQRPRFHAPQLACCRPNIRELVARKWKLEIDESSAGLGGFAWTVGETEARVLERFCREIEFDSLRNESTSDQEIEEVVCEHLGGGGIWGSNVAHGKGNVKWEWSVEQLATWFGRVVVGEVVREEEFGGVKYRP